MVSVAQMGWYFVEELAYDLIQKPRNSIRWSTDTADDGSNFVARSGCRLHVRFGELVRFHKGVKDGAHGMFKFKPAEEPFV